MRSDHQAAPTHLLEDRIVVCPQKRAGVGYRRRYGGGGQLGELLRGQDTVEKKGRKTYALPSILVLDVSWLGYAGQMLTEPGITRFQEQLDSCELGNLGGVLVVRSQLNSEILEALCWRGGGSLPLALAVGVVLLSSQMPKAA